MNRELSRTARSLYKIDSTSSPTYPAYTNEKKNTVKLSWTSTATQADLSSWGKTNTLKVKHYTY
jgi:hypothetical protein